MTNAIFPNNTLLDRLCCQAVSLTYDFDARSGVLQMPPGQCCDMTGCIAMFTAIDPEAKHVQTWAGKKFDTVYVRNGATWTAHRH